MGQLVVTDVRSLSESLQHISPRLSLDTGEPMTDKKESSVANWIAGMGWLVAALSLALNVLNYIDRQQEKESLEAQKPTFSSDIATYEIDQLPSELIELRNPIRHRFVISHRSGRSLKGITAAFRSKNAEISVVDVTEGKSGAILNIEDGALEATIRKQELLPGQTLRGFVTTSGVEQLSLTVAADNGERDIFAKEIKPTSRGIDYEDILLGGILILFIIMILALGYKSLPALKDSGIFDSAFSSPSHLALLILLALLSISNLSAGALLSAILVFFFVTNYRDLVTAVRNLASRNADQSADDGRG